MAAHPWMPFVLHTSLNDDKKAMMEMGQRDRTGWSSSELGNTLPALQHTRLLRSYIDSRYSLSRIYVSLRPLCGHWWRDIWSSVSGLFISLVMSPLNLIIRCQFGKIWALYATIVLVLSAGVGDTHQNCCVWLACFVPSVSTVTTASAVPGSSWLMTFTAMLARAFRFRTSWSSWTMLPSAAPSSSLLTRVSTERDPSFPSLCWLAIRSIVFFWTKISIKARSSSLWSSLLPSARAALPATKYLFSCLSIISLRTAARICSGMKSSKASYKTVETPLER